MSAPIDRVCGLVVLAFLGLAFSPASAEDAAPGSPSIETFLDAASQIRLAEQGVRATNVTLPIGHLQLSIADGVVTPLIGKAGLPLGIYFEGRGGWRYTASDPAEFEALRTNIDRTAKTLRMVGPNVLDDFKKFVVLFTEPMFDDLWSGRAEATLVAVPEGAARSAADILAAVHASYPEFGLRLAQARLNDRGQWVYVEIVGGLERIGLEYDDLRSGYERLVNFRNFSGYETRFTQTLATQAVPGWTPSKRTEVVLTKADIDIDTPDNKSGSINSNLVYTVRGKSTRVLSLNLLTTLDPYQKQWDWQKLGLTVKRVLDSDGHTLPFTQRYGEILVEIPETKAVETDVRLRFETGGEVFLDAKSQHSDNYFWLHGFDWFPVPPGWAGQQFTFHLKVRTKKPWRPVTSGKELSLVDDGDYFVAESASDHPSLLIGVFAGKYVTRQQTFDGLTVRVHGYAMARENVMDNMPRLTAALVTFYASLLGPLPSEELDIVEVPEYGFGIAPYGIVLITTEAFKARRDELAEIYSRGINSRLAHEVAHQWFGHRAWPVELADNWLAESFAEYFSGVAMGVVAAKDKTVDGFPRMLASWREESKTCDDATPIISANYLGGAKASYERRCLLYSRGPLVLHMLRTTIGNDRFIAATRNYLDTTRDGPATTDDYVSAVSAAVGTDMRWFFDQWVRASGVPTVDVSTHVEKLPDGKYRLSGSMRQTAGPHFKKLVVPLVFDIDGKPESRVVFVDQPEKAFDFVLDQRPGSVRVDPFHNNLAVYR